jgi:hypothetical protein
MALVGSISGSLGFTALTGTLLPGVATNELGSTTARWNIVHSNFVTGTLRKTAGGNDFIVGGPNVTANYNSLGQWEITGTGGGGGGSGVFTEASSVAAYTTSSIAIGFSAAASSKGSDVFFAVSGSTPGSNVSLFAGPVVATGSFSVKDAGNIVGQITETGVISGSALQSLGDLTVQGNAYLTGTLAVRSNQISGSAGGNIELGSNGDVTVAGDLTVAGNDIKASDGNTNITMTSNTLTEIKGDLQVTGNDIKMSGGTTALTFSGTGDVAVAGDLTVTSNDIVFSAGTGNIANAATSLTIGSGATTLNIGSASGRVVVPGDLEVQGTTMTVSASNLVIEDPLVGFGFLSGSVPGTSTGDRGFVGGYLGSGNNVAFGYSLSSTAFVATKTTSDATATTFAVSDLQPIRASKFQVSGSTAELKGDGSTLQLSGTQLDVFAGNKGLILYRDGTLYGDLTGQPTAYNTSNGLRLQAANATAAAISGSTVWLNADQGQVYIGRNTGGAPNSGFAITVDPAVAVTLAAKEGEGPSAAPRVMTLTGSSIALSANNSQAGVSIQDAGTEFLSFTKLAGTTPQVKATGNLILSGTTASVRANGDITLRTEATTQAVNYAIFTTTYASIASGSYTGGGTDAITLANAARISATNDLVIAASATAGSIVLSGSNAAYLNMGQNVTFQQAGTSFLQVLSSSYALQGVGTSQVTKLDGRNSNGILISPASGQKVFLSGSVELGGGVDNSVNFRGNVGTSILPAADSTYTLGSETLRWQHIYTGDLHLRNERGDYTLIEENDFLSIRFNKNGKRYKFLLERVPELDESR